MSSQPEKASPPDVNRVSLAQDSDVQYWTSRFDVTREELEEAIETVGESVDAVAVYLNR